MANSDLDLAEDIISFGQYDPEQLTEQDALTSIERAKRHLTLEADPDPNPPWYSDKKFEEALFWTSMLFSKLQIGALDSKAVAVGAIEEEQLLAAADDDVTQWYRQYKRERDRLRAAEANPSYQRRSARTTAGQGRYYDDERD